MLFIFAGPSFLPEYDDDLDDHILQKFKGFNCCFLSHCWFSKANDTEFTERGGLNMKYSDAMNETGDRSIFFFGLIIIIRADQVGETKDDFGERSVRGRPQGAIPRPGLRLHRGRARPLEAFHLRLQRIRLDADL